MYEYEFKFDQDIGDDVTKEDRRALVPIGTNDKRYLIEHYSDRINEYVTDGDTDLSGLTQWLIFKLDNVKMIGYSDIVIFPVDNDLRTPFGEPIVEDVDFTEDRWQDILERAQRDELTLWSWS